MNREPIPQRAEPPRLETMSARQGEAPVHTLVRESLGHIEAITREETEGVRRAEAARRLAEARLVAEQTQLAAVRNPLEQVVVTVGNTGIAPEQQAQLIEQLQEAMRKAAPDLDSRVKTAEQKVAAAELQSNNAADQHTRQDELLRGELQRAEDVRRETAGAVDWLDPREGNPHFVLRVQAEIRRCETRAAQVERALAPEAGRVQGSTEEALTQAERFNNQADTARREYDRLYASIVKKYSTPDSPNPGIALLLALPNEITTLRLLDLQARAFAELSDQQKKLAAQVESGLTPEERALLEAERARLRARIGELQAERPALFRDTVEDKTADLTPVDRAAVELKRELQKLEKLITGEATVETPRGGYERMAPEVMQRSIEEARAFNEAERRSLWDQMRTEATAAARENDQVRLADIRTLLVGVFGEEQANRIVSIRRNP
jgi:hypothetical protein